MYSLVIIEDDPSYRDMMETILGMEGYEVRTASSGPSGLALVREKAVDLILCDIMMPKMDGHCVLETLKTEKDLPDIPFIFVTAMAERSELRRGMSAGADDYLTKPFTADELLAAVTGRLRRHELRAERESDPVFEEKKRVVHQKVTNREREVLLLVGQGITSREIAERLRISLKTVEVHRTNLMRKLNATNAACLTRWAMVAEKM